MAASEAPQVGQIVDHQFLWSEEHGAGRSEGRKARPCLIVSVERSIPELSPRVTVLPITSQAPRDHQSTIEIPSDVKARIGLDRRRRAWLVIGEANVFTWPGFDLVPQRDGGFVRGVVTRGFFASVRAAAMALHSRGNQRVVQRDET